VRVYFDTNVLISAFATRGLCADVLRLALAEHEVVTSDVVVQETCRVLTKRLGIPRPVVDEVERFLRSQAVAPDPGETPDVALRDPQDLKVPAAALAGRVDVFVTGDREILGAAREIPIRVVNPRGLWELLRQRRRGVPPHRD